MIGIYIELFSNSVYVISACDFHLSNYILCVCIYNIYGYGSKKRLDRPAVIRTSGTRGLRKGA